MASDDHTFIVYDLSDYYKSLSQMLTALFSCSLSAPLPPAHILLCMEHFAHIHRALFCAVQRWNPRIFPPSQPERRFEPLLMVCRARHACHHEVGASYCDENKLSLCEAPAETDAMSGNTYSENTLTHPTHMHSRFTGLSSRFAVSLLFRSCPDGTMQRCKGKPKRESRLRRACRAGTSLVCVCLCEVRAAAALRVC
jgi:hypothetical protein